jgi:hypothetical protein
MENFINQCPTKLLFGEGQLENLANEILPFGNHILLVYGQKSCKETGLYDRIVKILKSAAIDWIELGGVTPNPKLSLVHQGIEICKNEKIDFILAVGGGSVIDASKAIAAGAKVDYDIWKAYNYFHSDLMHSPETRSQEVYIPNDAIPVGVVLTKSGTGSEFDLTSVVTNLEIKEKLLIMNPDLYPKFSICDPTLVYSLPKDQTAFGIADMMTHYFEQYFSPSLHTDFLDEFKEGILRTIVRNGPIVLENPDDYGARSELMYSAAFSCSSLNITGVIPEWSSHFIEHEITAMTELNHGLGMAIIYPAWMRYVSKEHPEKFAQYGIRVWNIVRGNRSDSDLALEAIQKTEDFWFSLGIPSSLTQVGIDPSIFPHAAKQAVRFGALGSLKLLGENDVLTILNMAR